MKRKWTKSARSHHSRNESGASKFLRIRGLLSIIVVPHYVMLGPVIYPITGGKGSRMSDHMNSTPLNPSLDEWIAREDYETKAAQIADEIERLKGQLVEMQHRNGPDVPNRAGR